MTVPRLLRALLAMALFAVSMAAAPRAASAAGDYLEVTITSLSTAALDLSQPDQEIEIRGELTNVSTMPIRYVNVHFWRSPQPLGSGAEIEAALEVVPSGARLDDEAAGNLDILTREDEFGPGERAQFYVKASVGQLTGLTGTRYPLTVDDVAYLVGVHVRGIPADGGNQIVGRAAAVVAATSQPVRSSALVLLTATPSWLPDGSFLDDSLSEELDGRLETLLTSAERDGVQAAIDPSLYKAVQALSLPHTVADEEAEASGVALRWVARVDALAAADRLWRLPYGDPDLVRAEANGALAEVLDWARDSLPADLARLDSVAILESGATAELVSQAEGFDTIIVRDATGSAEGSPRVLSAAPFRPAGDESASVQLARQVADELTAASPPLHLIETAAQAELDAPLAPWRVHVPADVTDEALQWPEVEPQPGWPLLADELGAASENAALIADLTGTQSTALGSLGAAAYARGFSREAAAVEFVKSAAPAKVDLSKVTLRAAASYVMGSRTNTFPATLTNGLDIPITVGVEFTSENPQRIRVPSLDPVLVGPGESATLNVTPEATANGVVLVHAQITTLSGATIGRPVSIEITATDFGRVGWIIIVVSGAVVLGGTALRIRAVRQERAKASVEEVDDPSQ